MIKQRSWGDCGVVALLNALQDNGVTFYNGPGGYESMVSNLNGRDYGITIQEVSSVILELGLVPVHIPLDGFAKESGIANAKASTIDPKDGLFKNWSKAIYQVKTKSGLLHFVYFDGYRIWDGSQNSPVYPKFSDYESVIDAVFILPGTPYSVFVDTDEITKFHSDHLARHKEWIENEELAEQSASLSRKVSEYEAARKVIASFSGSQVDGL